jgi:hypothetical protein
MAHQITISWNPNPAPVSGYNVYRGTSKDNESNIPLNSGLITGTSFTDNTVFPGVKYFYEVTAVAGGVESADSLEIAAAAVPFDPTPIPVDRGVSQSFAVLAGSTITNVPGSSTTIGGDVGVWPGTSITGFVAPASISGTFHSGDFVAQNAQVALTAAYNAAASAVNPPGLGGVPAQGPFTVTSCTVSSSGSANYLGTYPSGSSLVGQSVIISGFTNAVNNGTFVCTSQTTTSIALNSPNAVAETATASASVAAVSSSPFTTLPGDLGGLTLGPGVYKSASSVAITGTLVLDANGDPGAVWIFQIGSTLTTAANDSSVVLAGGAQAANVFWQVGSSATLGVGSNFAGVLMAQASITANTGARIDGVLLARTGAVTMDGNSVIMFLKAFLAVYISSKFYQLGTIIYDCATNSFQQVIVAGTTGPNRPQFSPTLGVITQDGGVTWVSLDPPEVNVQVPLPPSGPNTPPAPPAAPTGVAVKSEN